MSNEAETLIEQARALSPQDRIALVEDVLDSLDRAESRY
jgi:putative addiction module component (TIGR02574 family)